MAPGFKSARTDNEDASGEAAALDLTRIYAIQQMDTFNEIIDVVPNPYREPARTELSALFKRVDKAHKAKAALAGLNAHKEKKTWPAQLHGATVPHFQVSAEFSTSAEGAVIQKKIEDLNLEYKSAVLDAALELKTEEYCLLQESLHPQVWLPQLASALERVFNEGPATWVVPVATLVDGENRVEYLRDPTVEVVWSQVKHDLVYLGHAKAEAGPSSGPSTKDIEKMISVALAKERAKQGPKTMPKGPRAPPKNLGKGAPPSTPAPKTSTTLKGASGGGKRRVAGPNARPANQYPPTKVGKSPKRTELPECLAVSFLIKYVANDTDKAIAVCRSGIHIGPGVSMFVSSPVTGFSSLYDALADVNFGAGLKYMFPRGLSLSLPMLAYTEWCNTIRWKWHLKDKSNEAFEPEIYIRSGKEAEKAPQYIENGLMREAQQTLFEIATACKALSLHPYVLVKNKDGRTTRTQRSKWVTRYVELLEKDGKTVLDAVPRFYIIPKIHKNPWKGRPIVPAHSAMQSPAAKLCSMMLKPLVKNQPYIIHGSKDFIKKVSSIRWFKEERSSIYIVGGDIEAYYPNVPKTEASQIVKKMMDMDPRQAEENFGSFFEECLDVADSTVLMRFQDDWYVQTDGLSMGVAHAPDMANLYGAHFENQIIPSLGKDILYYGRYIDDVFFIVKANSAEAALQLCKNLVIGKCRIVWEPAKSYGVFLDVRLWIGEQSMEFKPHRKVGNHLERVPWISAHPLDVKKGTFLGELSRLATLCSSNIFYIDACADLRNLYIRRGYPTNLVNAWYNTYAKVMWEDCNRERPPPRDCQILRSTFNPVWEHVSISDIQDAVRRQWDKDLTWANLGGLAHIPPDMNKPLIVSRKKTQNLGDLVAKMRKIVLNYNNTPEDLGNEVTEAWNS
ncbi:hypothetical protein OPQ81_002533 [Rhizoctonia solani]|nr:hypothetical protein OPQ81_002533 [Rhizoctonia solani]